MMEAEHFTLPPRAVLASHGALTRNTVVPVARRVLARQQIAPDQLADQGIGHFK